MSANSRLRQLPSVNELLAEADGLIEREGHDRVVKALREALDAARESIRNGGSAPTSSELIATARASLNSPIANRESSIVNATGVILHTNLGRAPLSQAAQAAMLAVAQDYSPLEFDMTSGERGQRGLAVENLLCDLTGAEAALAVNNCAAATVLMLAAIAAGKGVVISRGQLVEIGGGFRVPDIMAQSGARLIEVGTTNRTKVADYRLQIEHAPHDIGAILRVHSSNFKMMGFVTEPTIDELVAEAHLQSVPDPVPRSVERNEDHGTTFNLQPDIPVLDDLGSGALIDTSQFGLSREPMPQDSVQAGVAVTCFSGDKLLGGPQAGLMVGQREWIEKCRKHPLARAFRADKFTLAALGATLLHYARGEAVREVPVLRMMALTKAEIAARAQKVIGVIGNWLSANELHAELIEGESTVGGGSLPGETLPTTVIALSPAVETRHGASLQARLRAAGVIARIKDERVLLDLRTVLDDQALADRLRQIEL